MERNEPIGYRLLAGAAFGLALTLAEVFTGYATGGRFPPAFWLYLALWYVPVFALLGASLPMGWLPPILVFLHTTLVVNQEFLKRDASLRGKHLVALAAGLALALLACVVARRPANRAGAQARDALGPLLLMPMVVVACSALGVGLLKDAPPQVGTPAFLACQLAGVGLGVFALSRARWLGSHRRAACMTVGLLLAAGVAGLGLSRPAPSYLRDLPQADPRPLGRWLEGKPNIVLIVLDAVRASSLSAYGYPRPTTPRLDAFARDAVLYTRCAAAGDWSLPSHASLFTGLFPGRHGADGPAVGEPTPPASGHPLNDRFDTLADILGRRGYATAGISASVGALFGRGWNVDQGLRYHDARPSSDALALAYVPLAQRFRDRLPSRLAALQDAVFPYHPTAREITERAEAWIRSRRAPGQPYFLFVHYFDAHEPYALGRRLPWPGRSRRLPPEGHSQKALVEIMGGRRSMTSEESQHLISVYDGALSYLDRHLGAFLDFLKAQPDYDNTWVVITSDHGDAHGEHNALGHRCTLYQEVVWIPLIIRYPASASGPRTGVDDRPVQHVDVLPTLLDGLGLATRDLDGRPIRQGRDAMLSQSRVNPWLAQVLPDIFRREIWAIRMGDMKYIETTNAPPQLFDLATDPRETRNLAGSSPDKAAALRDLMAAWKETLSKEARPALSTAPIPREQQEQLKTLRYLP